MKWFLALLIFAPITGWGQANTALAESCVRHYASHYGVPVELVAAFIDVESRWNPRAVSNKGALGLMQLMPATARRFGAYQPFDPEQNIAAGTRYVTTLMWEFHGDLRLVAAAYYAGDRWVGNAAAHIEVPAITRNIGTIAEYDPEFAVTIYGKVFRHQVDSQKETSFSGSQIMPISTSVSDMYGTATYALAGHFPVFLEDNPRAATEAAIEVVEGHIATRHPIPASIQEKSLQIGGTTVRLIEDGSRYWAWEIETGQPDSFQMIVQRLIGKLHESDMDQAKEMVAVFMATNRSAILWGRLLMVAAQKPDIYAPLLWDLATHEEILLCADTAKDAIDAIAAFYLLRTDQERSSFEKNVFSYGEGDPVYQSVRQASLETLFQTIREQNLVTDQARALAVPEEGEAPALNHRPLSFQGGAVEYPFLERLQDNGVDVEAPANSTLLSLIAEFNTKTGPGNLPRPQIEDLPTALGELRKLRNGIETAEAVHADGHIIARARQLLSNGNLAVLESAQRTKASFAGADLQTIQEIALSFSENDARNARDSIRELAVVQLYLLAQHPLAAKKAIKRLEGLASDADPIIRQAVLRNLATLFVQVPRKVPTARITPLYPISNRKSRTRRRDSPTTRLARSTRTTRITAHPWMRRVARPLLTLWTIFTSGRMWLR
jgi:soluble lytic murein transglycosylase